VPLHVCLYDHHQVLFLFGEKSAALICSYFVFSCSPMHTLVHYFVMSRCSCAVCHCDSFSIVTGYGLNDPGLLPGHLHSTQMDCRAHPASYPSGPKALSSGIKRPGAMVENGDAIPPLTYISSWHCDEQLGLHVPSSSSSKLHSINCCLFHGAHISGLQPLTATSRKVTGSRPNGVNDFY
jgi:hypothetical protein